MPDAPAPTHVGVDDWAMRKGCSYGTIVVDLDRHRVVDLLPDRTAATLAGWLLQPPDIKVVARDRSTEYARGASLGAPRAVQVADRCTFSPTCARPSNAGCKALMRGFAVCHLSLGHRLLPDEIAPSHARRRNAKQAQRAGSGGRPPTTKCGVGTPMGRRCSASPAPWACPPLATPSCFAGRSPWLLPPELPCANTRPPTPSWRDCPTARARACSTRTWTISWAGSARAARTLWRSGANSGSAATRARADKCTASSPSGGRSRPGRAVSPEANHTGAEDAGR